MKAPYIDIKWKRYRMRTGLLGKWQIILTKLMYKNEYYRNDKIIFRIGPNN